jgi:hypothetical protein
MSKSLPAAGRQMSNQCQIPKSKFLKFAVNHVRFAISPELYVVQEALTFGIFIKIRKDGFHEPKTNEKNRYPN